MSGLLTVDERADLAAEMLAALDHTYTRTPRTAGAADDWNILTVSDGTPVTGVVCHYSPASQARRDETGKIVTRAPQLVIGPSDPLATGDLVSNIRDAAGAVILAGPLVVGAVDPQSDAGIPLARHARLDGFSVAQSAEAG